VTLDFSGSGGLFAPRLPYVKTKAIKAAAKGHEDEIVRAIGIPWRGRDHIRCPYPDHDDKNPSWRLMASGLAICTCCAGKTHTVFDVAMKVVGIDFEAAKIRVAQLIGRTDLIINPADDKGLTLEEYAEAKRLPREFLIARGVRQQNYFGKPAIRIPYFRNEQDENPSIKFRLSLTGQTKTRWKRGDRALLYGAWLASTAKKVGYVIIVEGESDCHTLWLHEFPALGLPGAGTWNEERDAPLFAGIPAVFVVIEPDTGGAATLAWLSRSSIASRARLVRMPPATKDPSALYLTDPEGFPAALAALLDAAQPPLPGFANSEGEADANTKEPDDVDADATSGVSLEDFYAYMPMHNYIYAPTRTTWPAVSVNARISPIAITGEDGKKLLRASAWLDRNRPVEQMIWAPGLPIAVPNKLLLDGGWIERQGVTCFNLYHPPTIAPGDPTNATIWLDHIRYVYPDDTDHILDWLAHRVQKPQDKINHALVLGGEQGIGKDTILEPVKLAVGPWNFQEISPVQVLGRFNGFLKSVILRVSEARDLGEFDRFQFYDHMKTYTAAPPDMLRIDEKNLREYLIVNCCGVLLTTNHKIDGIYLPSDDRRHYVAWSELTKEDVKFRDGYWNKISGFYKDGGSQHVTAYLLQRDIGKFDPKAPPPKTAAFWTIADGSRAPEESELADLLEAAGRPDAITLTRLQTFAEGDFTDWLKDRKNRRVIPHRLEKCRYTPVRNPDAQDGLWKIQRKRQAVYAKIDLSLPDQIEAARKL
jgi:hypothetical protein